MVEWTEGRIKHGAMVSRSCKPQSRMISSPSPPHLIGGTNISWHSSILKREAKEFTESRRGNS